MGDDRLDSSQDRLHATNPDEWVKKAERSWSNTSRTARSRPYGENLFVVFTCHRSTFSGVGASDKPGAVHFHLVGYLVLRTVRAVIL